MCLNMEPESVPPADSLMTIQTNGARLLPLTKKKEAIVKPKSECPSRFINLKLLHVLPPSSLPALSPYWVAWW